MASHTFVVVGVEEFTEKTIHIFTEGGHFGATLSILFRSQRIPAREQLLKLGCEISYKVINYSYVEIQMFYPVIHTEKVEELMQEWFNVLGIKPLEE